MTENQKKLIELSNKYEKIKDELNAVGLELGIVLNQLELNTYFQDLETLAVYKIVKPKGTFVAYKDVDYVRTAFESESRGSLSKKEAEEAGFSLKK